MKIQITVDCSSLDDLKSARTHIDRLIAGHESNLSSSHRETIDVLSGQVGTAPIPQVNKIENLGGDWVKISPSPIHYAPYGPNKLNKFECGANRGEGYTGSPNHVTCEACKRCHPGLWPEYKDKPVDFNEAIKQELDGASEILKKNIAAGRKSLEAFTKALEQSTSTPIPVERRNAIPHPYKCDCGISWTDSGVRTQGDKCYCGRSMKWWVCKNCDKIWDKTYVYVRNTNAYMCPCGYVQPVEA